MRELLFTICLPILAVGGVALGLVVGPMEVARAREGAAWPAARATITRAEIEESFGRRGRRYRPVIHYSYEVDGRTYAASQLSLYGKREYLERQEAESVLERLAGGEAAEVRYDPARPEQAVLETASTARAVLVVGAGVAMLLLSGAILWLRSRRPARP